MRRLYDLNGDRVFEVTYEVQRRDPDHGRWLYDSLVRACYYIQWRKILFFRRGIILNLEQAHDTARATAVKTARRLADQGHETRVLQIMATPLGNWPDTIWQNGKFMGKYE